jgi:hypothetical protein
VARGDPEFKPPEFKPPEFKPPEFKVGALDPDPIASVRLNGRLLSLFSLVANGTLVFACSNHLPESL